MCLEIRYFGINLLLLRQYLSTRGIFEGWGSFHKITLDVGLIRGGPYSREGAYSRTNGNDSNKRSLLMRAFSLSALFFKVASFYKHICPIKRPNP